MDQVETPPDPGQLAEALHAFGLSRDAMRAALARRTRMSSTDLDALEHLEAVGPLTQRQLGRRLAITSGAVTMLVDRLAEAGWVVRRPHPGDRRAVLVELTDRAARDQPAALVTFHRRIAEAAEAVPSAHRAAVMAFLRAAAAEATVTAEALNG
jgi:DNA-binding MarR family transcriptional regulator